MTDVLTPPKTSLVLIEKILARTGLAIAYANDSRIIGVYIQKNDNPLKALNFEGVADVLKTTLKFHKGWQWFVAGMVVAGLDLSEDFAQYLPTDHTVEKWVSIYKQYDIAERCFDLSFSHYEEVAYIKDRRARANLLSQAYEKKWTVDELRAAKAHEQSGNASGIKFTIYSWQSEATAAQLYQQGQIDRRQLDELQDNYGAAYVFTVDKRLVGTK